MKETRDYLQMATDAAMAFANDGTLDEKELSGIIDIALLDGQLDDNEIRVLSGILGRLREAEFTDGMLAKIRELEDKFNVTIL